MDIVLINDKLKPQYVTTYYCFGVCVLYMTKTTMLVFKSKTKPSWPLLCLLPVSSIHNNHTQNSGTDVIYKLSLLIFLTHIYFSQPHGDYEESTGLQ